MWLVPASTATDTRCSNKRQSWDSGPPTAGVVWWPWEAITLSRAHACYASARRDMPAPPER
jgi:hypothetical protein